MKLCNSYIYIINQNDKKYFEKLENFLKKTYKININKRPKNTLVIYNDIKTKEEINFDKIDDFNFHLDTSGLFDINNITNNNEKEIEIEKNINYLKLNYNVYMINLSNLTKKFLDNYIFDNFL